MNSQRKCLWVMGVWNLITFKVASNPSHFDFMILWAYEVISSSQVVIQCPAAPVAPHVQTHAALSRHCKKQDTIQHVLEKSDLHFSHCIL